MVIEPGTYMKDGVAVIDGQIKYTASRLPRIDRIRTAYIMIEDMAIGTISEEYDSVSEQFDWVIKPFYDKIEQYNKEYHDDIYIPGIDLTLKRKEFIRRYIPCFVEHRTPNDNRRGLDQLLKRLNLPFNDRFEYMCRSHGVCSSDNFYVSKRIDDVVNVYLWYEPGVKVDLDIPIESKNLDFVNEGWLEKPIYTDIPH